MDLGIHDVFYRIWICIVDDMKYSIGLMEENDLDGDKLYTFNVFKRIFFGYLWIPVFSYSGHNKENGMNICKKYVENKKGILIDYDD